MRRWALAIVCALLATGCSTGQGDSAPSTTNAPEVSPDPTTSTVPRMPRTQVILDYSPTVSDVGALLYLLSEPRVDLLAVTMPETGEAGCELGLEVTLRLLALFERDDVAVACGRGTPSTVGTWPEAFLSGSRNLTFGLPPARSDPDTRDVPTLLAEVVHHADRPVVLVAVAPLTDVAAALELRPDVAGGLDRVVIMGGAVDVPGNVFDGSAEWNVWIDVDAADVVLNANVPATLVPLDATNALPIPDTWEIILDRADGGPALEYVRRLVDLFPAVTSGGFYLWDELAAMVAVDPAIVVSESLPITVVTTDPGRGATVRDPAGRSVEVATGVPDPELAYVRLLSTIAGEEVAIRGPADEATLDYFSQLQASFQPAEEALRVFGSEAFGAEPYDGDAAADALVAFGDALRQHADALASVDPPEDLAALHTEYVSALDEAIVFIGPFAERLRTADSAEAAFDTEAPLEFDRACEALTEEAAYRGVDLVLFCGA